MSTSTDDGGLTSRPDGWHDFSHLSSLESITEEIEHGPNETTVFPKTGNAFSVTTEWLTARADAFLDLDEMR